MKRSIMLLAVLLSACVSLSEQKERPLIYEDQIVENHARLARCVMSRLQADSRWSFRLLRFSHRVYPDIGTAEIVAHDMRLLPGVYARNSPTNPDAVLDPPGPNPEIRSSVQKNSEAEPPYVFNLLIEQRDEIHVQVTLRGERNRGERAWRYVQACASTPKRGANDRVDRRFYV
ncbi:MAG TPA: hypothetical protein DEO56_10955 [Nitrosomonas nitrosa]|jgi:hypothetical protein|uniref:Lipoprotein n=1 Tax=Nitrosomonas nitrosa TaxID=52442 RepID=A0A1I4R3C0_9PROT|nr:hypothetical protein [Nitrosomonas nitrosa]MCO6433550.1 hypothetical protein [Nitrosomonas nitrosa]PTR00168.1 hypothetical protein C8R30_10856 [Nitrosomonas nitrosa]CAE6509158.1 conserved hypothetical protein [Nitrosomonas nitrosa]SFM46759.1 hypothetical protein SAMN05421880_11754 [Nitrosomonas nitrosa]HBZ31089.1 hypothetical protein [Nitrosomonas nitrosa]